MSFESKKSKRERESWYDAKWSSLIVKACFVEVRLHTSYCNINSDDENVWLTKVLYNRFLYIKTQKINEIFK